MQELKPRDMSLPDRVSVLERRLDKSENKRKVLMELVLEMMQKEGMRLNERGKQMLEMDSLA